MVKKTRKKLVKNKSKKISKRLKIISIITGIIISIFSYVIFFRAAVPGISSYQVEQGTNVSQVGRDLDQGILFKILIFINGNKVMAGLYDIPNNAGLWRIANMFATGKVASIAITIPEGLTIKQIEKVLAGEEFLTGEIIKGNYKEGELFPSTYYVPKGTDRNQVLDLMAKQMYEIEQGCLQAMPEFPKPLKDWNEVMTLASIVQKETAKKSEMPMVASVYLNRLKTKMRLQADPTVVYAITNGLGDMRQRRLYEKHLQIKSPFNTYKNFGLPPSPIANVGIDAIKAVLNPDDTNYYYFVADGSGGHSFSRTLDEHNKKRAIWEMIKKDKSIKNY